MMNTGYQQYKTQTVETMTNGEMLVLLYDEINKRLLRGRRFFENGEIEAFEADVQRAIDIISYLIKSLDMKYPISRDLYRMYDFFTYQLNRLKIGRNMSIIDEVVPMVKDMRDSFREADKRTKTDPKVAAGIGNSMSNTFGVG